MRICDICKHGQSEVLEDPCAGCFEGDKFEPAYDQQKAWFDAATEQERERCAEICQAVAQEFWTYDADAIKVQVTVASECESRIRGITR